nr:ATP synthase F0 subunit 8 [Asiopsocus sonorensis]
MPQMNPMNWITLFITFSFLIFKLNSLTYFLKNNKIILNSMTLSKNHLTWKW